MKSKDILIALTRTGGPFSRRTHIVVPRVYWGWGLHHEADLISISRSGICTEIEIKVSAQDLRKDQDKRKWKRKPDSRIQRFYYAVPEKLKDLALEIAGLDKGVIVVRPGNQATASLPVASVIKNAKTMPGRKPYAEEVHALARLGVMRYWDLFLKEPNEKDVEG